MHKSEIKQHFLTPLPAAHVTNPNLMSHSTYDPELLTHYKIRVKESFMLTNVR